MLFEGGGNCRSITGVRETFFHNRKALVIRATCWRILYLIAGLGNMVCRARYLVVIVSGSPIWLRAFCMVFEWFIAPEIIESIVLLDSFLPAMHCQVPKDRDMQTDRSYRAYLCAFSWSKTLGASTRIFQNVNAWRVRVRFR